MAVDSEPVLIDPFACRMWDCHDRLPDLINENTCRDVIDSFVRDGQKHPVLARQCRSVDARYELIYGARRLFAARHLNVKLLARIRAIDDATAFVEMDIENRLRRDISPYERGMSFRAWLRSGHFRCQEEIATTLGLSKTQVSRLLKFSELPTAIVIAFPDPRHIRETWAVTLAERSADPEKRQKMLNIARSVSADSKSRLDSAQIYRLLIDGNPRATLSRVAGVDQVIRSRTGTPLFRVCYRHNDLHLVIRRDLSPPDVVHDLVGAVRPVLENQEAAVGAKPGQRNARRACGRVVMAGDRRPRAVSHRFEKTGDSAVSSRNQSSVRLDVAPDGDGAGRDGRLENLRAVRGVDDPA